VAVDPAGNPWVINTAHQIFHCSGHGWLRYPGAATDIAVGANRAVWVVETSPTAGGARIYRWTGRTWTAALGGAVTVAVDPGGNPWVINAAHQIYSS
jgi:hypothetical protein